MTDEPTMTKPDYLGQGVRGPLWAMMGTGVGAAALYALNTLFRGGFGPGMPPPGGDPPWARDMNYERELTKANAEIGRLEAEKYASEATLAAERRLADKIEAIEKAMNAATAAQAVLNAKQEGFIGSLAAQVASFDAMTARYIRQPIMAASEAALSAFSADGKAAGTQGQGTNG